VASERTQGSVLGNERFRFVGDFVYCSADERPGELYRFKLLQNVHEIASVFLQIVFDADNCAWRWCFSEDEMQEPIKSKVRGFQVDNVSQVFPGLCGQGQSIESKLKGWDRFHPLTNAF